VSFVLPPLAVPFADVVLLLLSAPLDPAPQLATQPFPLLQLPGEILFIIGQYLLLRKGVEQEPIRSLRCSAKRLASTLRPLAWAGHYFAPESEGPKEPTKQLLRDVQLQSYVRHVDVSNKSSQRSFPPRPSLASTTSRASEWWHRKPRL
jgi:hypothetical protein